jgi:hypothetical protein
MAVQVELKWPRTSPGRRLVLAVLPTLSVWRAGKTISDPGRKPAISVPILLPFRSRSPTIARLAGTSGPRPLPCRTSEPRPKQRRKAAMKRAYRPRPTAGPHRPLRDREQRYREEAARLRLMDRETQRQIVAVHRNTAANPKLSRASRDLAHERAEALERLLGLGAPRKH